VSGGEATLVEAPDGVRLAVHEWGNPAGPELVLVHGFAQCHLCFAPQFLSDLSRDFRIVAYDFRGHGGSDKPADAKAYQGREVWANDLAAVLKAKQLKRPVLAGWSMGGRVIRQYLMNFGDAGIAGINFVGSLVLEYPECRGPGASLRPQGAAPSPTSSLATQLDAAIAFIDACYEIKPDERQFRIALAYNMLVTTPVRQAIGGWSTDPEETFAALKRVRVPVLVTHGRKDIVVLPSAAVKTAAAISNARLSWYGNCGHSPFQEDAPRFNRELAAFVREAGQA
jgi:pimeloyl-ACP methyl ester carboxylesterase